MKRRAFIAGLGGAAAWPLVARGQEVHKIQRVGFLRPGNPDSNAFAVQAFLSGMRDLGYIEGQNLALELRYWGNNPDTIEALVRDLVHAKTEIIIAPTSQAARATQAVTRDIPIVFTTAVDPVGNGLIASYARPGGNATGLSIMIPEITVKRLELLKDAVPAAARVAVLQNPDNQTHPAIAKEIEAAALSLGISIKTFKASATADDLERAFAAMSEWHADAALQMADANFLVSRSVLGAQSARHRLPVSCEFREMAEAGCLLSYSADLRAIYRRAATYVGQILKGASPGDLPVEQPTKFDLVINLKTAKVLGLAIPPQLLARADEVIE